MSGKNLGDAIFTGGIEGLVVSLMHSFGKTAEEKGGEYLKSKMFGAGTNDEHLFLSACTYALKKKMLTSEQLIKILNVVESYSSSQKSRITSIFGKTEEDVVIEEPKLNEAGNVVTDRRNKPVMVKTSFKANVKGAQMLEMLAKLNEQEIKKILDATGASASFMSNLKKTVDEMTQKVESSQLHEDCKNFFAQETWLEKLAREKSTT